ncbi:MAG: DUF5050 domain-containing protein [Clostridiales bacterium]|nr:DUF5050 domain-containing protein [Clostridiales bacterium]
MKRWVKNVIWVVAVLVVLVAAILLVRGAMLRVRPSDVTRIQVVGDWIYFSGFRHGDNNLWHPWQPLFRMRLDGSRRQRITGDRLCHTAFLATEDWVFYTSETDQHYIYRMRPNGSKREKLGEGIRGSVIEVADGWVYYMAQNRDHPLEHGGFMLGDLSRIRTDGSDCEKLTEQCFSANTADIDGDWIYFGGTRGVFKMRTDGSDCELLYSLESLEHGFVVALQVSDDWIYYSVCEESTPTADSGLHRIKKDGTSHELLDNIAVHHMNPIRIVDGWVYYISWQAEVCRISTDGTGKAQLSDSYLSARVFTDDWVYYFNEEGVFRMRPDGTEIERLY